MIGIPGEIESDLREIVTMAETTSRMRSKVGKGRPGKVNAAVSTFVPKPHTPFQWHGQMTLDQVRHRQRHLESWKREPMVALKCHDSERSVIEGVMSRADRRVGRAIERAYRLGARLDAWDEYFDYQLWLRAFEETGIDPWWYANRMREKDEVFPWDHIDGGVHKDFQWEEYEKSVEQRETPSAKWAAAATAESARATASRSRRSPATSGIPCLRKKPASLPHRGSRPGVGRSRSSDMCADGTPRNGRAAGATKRCARGEDYQVTLLRPCGAQTRPGPTHPRRSRRQ